MEQLKGTDRFYIRPGIIFWKEGDSGYFFLDQLTSEAGNLNESGYHLMTLLNSQRTLQEVCRKMYTRYAPAAPGLTQEQITTDVKATVGRWLEQQIVAQGDIKQDLAAYRQPHVDELQAFYGVSHRPGLVYWEITNACNYRCIFCYNSSGRPRPEELSLEEGLMAIDRMKDAGVTGIIFTGGEPMMAREKLFAWIKHASQLEIAGQLFSNGSCITPEYAQRLAEAGLRYARITIHGGRAEVVDKIAGVKGAFDRSLAGMRNLIAAGVPVCWQMTANKHNLPELRLPLDLAVQEGCHGFRVGSLDIMGLGEDQETVALDPADELTLWRFIDESILVYRDRIHVGWGADSCLDQAWDYYIMRPRYPVSADADNPDIYFQYAKNSLCGVGFRSWAMTACGDITPCPALSELVMGNIRTDDLLDVWENGEYFNILRSHTLEEFEKCHGCGFRFTCVGGCRALAYHRTGSLLGADPRRCAAVEWINDRGQTDVQGFFTSQELRAALTQVALQERRGENPYQGPKTEGLGPWIPFTSVTTRKMFARYWAYMPNV